MGDRSQLWNGHYQIRKEIGEGQYGQVFLARDVLKDKSDENQRVAIKVLKIIEQDDDDDEDFEAQIFQDLYKK